MHCLTITTDLNQYTNIISATKALKKRWDIVLKRLRRELDKFHRKIEHYANGEISEEELDEYFKNECPFDLKYGYPPESKELKYLNSLEFSLGDGKPFEGHGAPHLHILLDNVFFNVNGIRMIREAVGEHCKIIHVRRYLNTNILKYVLDCSCIIVLDYRLSYDFNVKEFAEGDKQRQ